MKTNPTPTHPPTETVSACCGAEVETKYSSMLDKKQYTCTKCWLINCKVVETPDKTKQCFCQSIYNGETNTVDNCTCGKCADAIKPTVEKMGVNERVIHLVGQIDGLTRSTLPSMVLEQIEKAIKSFLSHSVQEAKAEGFREGYDKARRESHPIHRVNGGQG